MIQQPYIITNNTYALKPAKDITYGAIIMEETGTIRVQETPLDILKHSCIHYWSTYEGRRAAVNEHLGYKKKTPIPVSIVHKLCFFPTHAPTHMDTVWINRAQVNHWGRIEKEERTNEKQTEIMFNNWKRIELGVSMHTLQQQMEKAFRVMIQSGMVEVR